MKIEVKPFVIVHDNKPGNEATLIDSDGQKFIFRPELSSFNDGKREYSWVFEGEVWPGCRITFSTTDRSINGFIRDDRTVEISDDAPPVAVVMSTPHPRGGTLRPEKLKRKP